MLGALVGLPAVALGPEVMAEMEGLFVVGVADGLPGVTLGYVVVGTSVEGLSVAGVANGLPNVVEGLAVV